MARLGQEYLVSNRHTAYPFREGSSALRYPNEVPTVTKVVPTDFLLDAVIVTDEHVTAVYLNSIEYTAGMFQLGLGVNFSGINGYINFYVAVPDVAVDIRAQIDATRYYTFTVTGTTIDGGYDPDDADHPLTVRLMGDVGFINLLDQVQALGTINPSKLGFAPHVIQNMSPRVEAFDTYSDLTTPKEVGITGHAQLVPGYNIAMNLATEGTDTHTITLSAVPGAGAGIVPCDQMDDEALVALTPMGLAPDALGAVRIEGDACYEIVPDRLAGEVKIYGTCYACCTCDDYVATATALKLLIERTHAARLALDEVRADHTAALDDYTTRHFPELRRGYLSIQAFRGFSPGAVNHGHVTVKLVNKGEDDMAVADLTLTPAVGTKLLGGSYRIGDSPTAVTCGLVIASVTVPKGESLTAVYRFYTTGTDVLSTVAAEANVTIGTRVYVLTDSTTFGVPN